MRKAGKTLRGFSKAMFGAWEIWGWLLWIGGALVTGAYSFILAPIIAPFLADAHLGLKVMYGIGLAILLFLFIVAVVKALQYFFGALRGDDNKQPGIKQNTGGGPGNLAIVSGEGRNQQQAGQGNTQMGDNSLITNNYNIETFNGDLPPSLHPPIKSPDFDDTNQVLLNLRRLRSDGVMLRNAIQRISELEFLQHWVQEAQQWRLSVVEKIEKLSPIDASFFETLNTFSLLQQQPKVANPVQDLVYGIDHQRWANIHNERLNRLEQFMSTFKRRPN